MTGPTQFPHSKVVPHVEWLAARKEYLAKEKEFTRLRDELSRQRRELPWEKVEKLYVFDGPQGKQTLADLFQTRSQLFVHHFMFSPAWKEGCPICSLWADHYDPLVIHLANRDVAVTAISRAPLPQIEDYKRRMGWHFQWVSSFGTDFNYDYHVSFTPEELANGEVYYNYAMRKAGTEEAHGGSVFYKDENGDIFHTYSTYSRGVDILLGVYNFLDLMPKGRDESNLRFGMAWVKRHDRYTDTSSF